MVPARSRYAYGISFPFARSSIQYSDVTITSSALSPPSAKRVSIFVSKSNAVRHMSIGQLLSITEKAHTATKLKK